mgnify:CR=1 FL=1
MKESIQNTWTMIVDSNLLPVISALLVLILGWLLAVVISRAARNGVSKLGRDEKIGKWVSNEHGHYEKGAKLVGALIYYTILLFTVVCCLSVLNLSQAAEPIQNFISQLTGYIPNLIGAALLGLIAFFVAKALEMLSSSLAKSLKIDERTPGKAPAKPLSSTVSEVVYWTTWLFFLPAILNALKIEGITEPLQQMLSKVMAYVPNLIAAAAILFFGLLAAKIVRNAVNGLLAVVRLDELGKKAGTQRILGDKGITNLVGLIAYILVAIPVITAALHALKIEALTNMVSGFFNKILGATANLIGAGLLIIAAFIIAGLVSGMVAQLVEGMGFNKLIARLGFGSKVTAENTTVPTTTPANVVGKLTFLAIMLFAAISAAEMLGFLGLSDLLKKFTEFGGNIIIAAIVMVIGMFLANFAADAVRGKGANSELIAFIIKITVWIFTGAIAIHNLGIGGPIVQTAFTLILGAVCVAIAIAFGIGGREFAAGKLNEWSDKFKK